MEKFVNYTSLIVLTYLLGITTAHVSLTFPPARKLDLDFLDFRTKVPCGMPKGKFRTTLEAGSTVNVTWHLAYPHVGGFRLELLDKSENFTMKLSDPASSDFYVVGDPTAQWHSVQVPDQPCEDCTLRLVREAKEWRNYSFWSCADISIVQSADYKEDCLGRAKARSSSVCTCDKGYWGPRCQYKDECDIDSDCGKGKCVDIGGTTLPRKQCFCSAGYHGDRCRLQNKDTLPTPENIELSGHKKIVLSDRMTLYHRIHAPDGSGVHSDKEIEFILIVNGTSFGAVGWRPSSIDKSCRSIPAIDENDTNVLTRKTRAARGRPQKSNPTLLEPLHAPERIMAEAESTTNSKRSTKIKATVRPEPEPEGPASESEPAPEPETEPKPESAEIKAEPEASSDCKGKPQAESKYKPRKTPNSEPEGAQSEPKPEIESHNEPKSEPEVSTEPKSEPEVSTEPKSEPEVSTEPKSEPEVSTEPKSEPEASSEPKPEPETSSEPKSEPETSNEPIPEPEANTTESSQNSKLKVAPTPESEVEPESEATKAISLAELSAEPEGEPEKTSYEPETAADESVASVVYAEPESYNQNFQALNDISPYKLEKKMTAYTPKGGLHPMDCTDIVIGTARGMHSRVRDFYTRDRSSPRLDTIYGGTEDITSATGWEKDGITTIIFRRKIETGDPMDHSISGPMTVIWSRGQEHGEYNHNPKSGLEKEKPSIPNFYGQDELKYHGQSDQRGVKFKVNFS